MQNTLYSITGSIAILIHIIINQDILRSRKSDGQNKAYGSYRFLLICILVYFLTDILWGFLIGFRYYALLYVDTIFCYLSLSISVIAWINYMVKYLGEQCINRVFLRIIGSLFLGFEIVCLVVNLFIPVFFCLDEKGGYHVGVLRNITLIIEVIFFFLTAIRAGYNIVIISAKEQRRHVAILLKNRLTQERIYRNGGDHCASYCHL